MTTEEKNTTIITKLEINEIEADLLLEAISIIIKKLVQCARQNELIINNIPLRSQYTASDIEAIEKRTREQYLHIVLLKRIANKIRKNRYHEEETKI